MCKKKCIFGHNNLKARTCEDKPATFFFNALYDYFLTFKANITAL